MPLNLVFLADWATRQMIFPDTRYKAVTTLLLPLAVLVLSIPTRGLLGTLLPHSIDGDPRFGPIRALRTAPRSIALLSLAALGFGLAAFGVAVLANWIRPFVQASPVLLDLFQTATLALIVFLGLCNTVLTAALLTAAYRRACAAPAA